MKRSLLSKLYIILTTSLYSQVGINTVNPTETLDVNGTTRIRTLPASTSTNIVVAESDGTLGIATVFNQQTINYPTVYIDDVSYYPIWTDNYVQHIRDIDFNFERTITIPDGKTAWIRVEFYMPIGLYAPPNTRVAAYQGACLWRNGIILDNECSKINLKENSFIQGQGQDPDIETFRCSFVQNLFKEEIIDVLDGNDTVITYSVRGYLEHYYKSIPINEGIAYFWGYFSDNNNYHWGKASLDIEVTY